MKPTQASSIAALPTRKLVHQLSSTSDPIFSLKVPASRIVGGYTVKNGVIVPHYSHGEIIEAVFRRTRVTVGVMTSAKLLSRDRADHPLSARPFPRRRAVPPRASPRYELRPAAKGRYPPPPGGHLGHRRSQRLTGLCRRAPLRRSGSPGTPEK